jgi:predicted DNA binding CopG/RHH family protein
MTKQVTYTDAPCDIEAALDRAVQIVDFLPSPAELAGKSEKQKVTIMLDKSNVEFFKQEAAKNGVRYQTMINNLLGSYAAAHGANKRLGH